jgi:hypothetical protein
MNPDEMLKRGLKRWRQLRLHAIEERMLDLNEDYREASEGLALAHRNQGIIAEDVVEYLWDQLDVAATSLTELETRHQELLEMDLPHLVIVFKRERKETVGWAFQNY